MKNQYKKSLSETQTYYQFVILPQGYPCLMELTGNEEGLPLLLARQIKNLFQEGEGKGLLCLGVTSFSAPLSPEVLFWQHYSQFFITAVCQANVDQALSAEELSCPDFPVSVIQNKLDNMPFMKGAEYLNLSSMLSLWQEMYEALVALLQAEKQNFSTWLKINAPAFSQVGRVCFHLAENKRDSQFPFAFLATYAACIANQQHRVSHLPLGKALQEYAKDKGVLLRLLLPIQQAAQTEPFLKELVDSGAIFKPLAWRAQEAHAFLKMLPCLETTGIVVRTPDWWKASQSTRPKVSITIGKNAPGQLSLDALLDFQVNVSLPDGEKLEQTDIQALLASGGGLVQLKGRWVDVDTQKLEQVLLHWKKIEKQIGQEGISIAEALRMGAGLMSSDKAHSSKDIEEWSIIANGDWLEKTLSQLRSPEQMNHPLCVTILKTHLQAVLRPYQEKGVQWLWTLYQMSMGGCLADDMGLGKTVQVISLFLLIKHHVPVRKDKLPHLLILPASLLGNWQSELARFANSLFAVVLHASEKNSALLKQTDLPDLNHVDIVITTYAHVGKIKWLKDIKWDMLVLDEAQAIKNPLTKQSQAVKSIESRRRFILTGTPIENNLMDLWSLFDFVMPGLLGSSKAFTQYSKNTQNQPHFNAALRKLISPYLLRRLKSDKQIIADLPDKTEMSVYCSLSKYQAALYQQAVEELSHALDTVEEGIQRRGLIFSYLARFKQICNHPNQWSGHGSFNEKESGKFLQLRTICESIAARQEKVLVFTQFSEIIPPLFDYLSGIFQQQGLTLDGSTPVKERARRVERFQAEQAAYPFFILSLKAGGTGLNLTQASHVIHFDRWWNPAVENQATDRAYRIGQKKNILVHKFICSGTIEEKIDLLIKTKQKLVSDMIGETSSAMLTEMNNDELINLVSLDIHRALNNETEG